MSSATPRVSVVVLHYSHVEDTTRCVASVRASSYVDQQVVVVDNSQDDAHFAELTATLPPGTELVRAPSNGGYAAGNNIALRRGLHPGGPEFFWVVNPDTVVRRDTLELMVACADEVGDAGAVGCRLVHGDEKNRIWFDGGLIDDAVGGVSHRHSGAPVDRVGPPVQLDVDYVSGASMLLRARAVKDAGLMPEHYFLYYEETTYCRTLTDRGWRVLQAPDATMEHYKRSSGDLPADYFLYYLSRARLGFGTAVLGLDPDLVWADHVRAFVDPWRARVAARAPGRLGWFDALVTAAREDFDRGLTGPRDLTQLTPAQLTPAQLTPEQLTPTHTDEPARPGRDEEHA